MQHRIELPITPAWVREFKAFIMRGNVVDLAIGIIIGAAFTSIVTSLVKDIFNPVIGTLIGGVDFTNVFIALNGHHYDTLDAAQKAGAPTLNVGLFINAVINFLIVAFSVFWVVKAMSRFVAREKAEPAAPPHEEVLLGEIRDILRDRLQPPSPASSAAASRA
jgi:large conductance mechanosensitive channel